MWPFSKKWTLPEPQLAMVVSLTGEVLPSLMMLANPEGAGGAVEGMAGPADGELTRENMTSPMTEGDYMCLSPAEGACSLQVERVDPESNEPLSFDPDLLEAAGLTREMLDQFNRPAWRAMLRMEAPGGDVQDTVVFATKIAKRLAELAGGIVMDVCAYRFFGPNGWPVDGPVGDFDVREHVHTHLATGFDEVANTSWVHTHGLTKFGRPELEIYDVPAGMEPLALSLLLETAHRTITSEGLLPEQTCWSPEQPFHARLGRKNREEHWEDIPVLELVDVDDRNCPVDSGAPKALQAFAAHQ